MSRFPTRSSLFDDLFRDLDAALTAAHGAAA